MVTHQLQLEHRTGKIYQSQANVLPPGREYLLYLVRDLCVMVEQTPNFSCLLWWYIGILQWTGSTGILCSQPWALCGHRWYHARIDATAFQIDLRRRSRVQVLLSGEKWSVSRTRWTEIAKLTFIYYENRTQSTSKKKTNTDRKKTQKYRHTHKKRMKK